MRWSASRRRLLTMCTGAAAALLATPRWFDGALHMALARSEGADGELFNGFLILPWDGAVPSSVVYPSRSLPIMEHLPGGPLPTAVTSHFDTARELAADVGLPLYSLGEAQAPAASGYVVRDIEGTLFSASLQFTHDRQGQVWELITVQPQFPSPYPVRDRGAPEPGIQPVMKVGSMPAPGVAVPTLDGFVGMWFEGGLLYKYEVRGLGTVTPDGVAARLVRLN